MKHIHISVHGAVQGVAYRHHTKLKADELGLAGYCRNLSDGSVEIVVSGADADVLTDFVEWTKIGSPASAVSYIAYRDLDDNPRPASTTFEILR